MLGLTLLLLQENTEHMLVLGQFWGSSGTVLGHLGTKALVQASSHGRVNWVEYKSHLLAPTPMSGQIFAKYWNV